MTLSYKILAVLLLTAMAAVSGAVRQELPMAAMEARPAGCHQHGAKPPAPTPVSYRCCQSGHDSAIVLTRFATQLSSAQLACGGGLVPASFSIPAKSSFNPLIIASSDPPPTIPLRV